MSLNGSNKMLDNGTGLSIVSRKTNFGIFQMDRDRRQYTIGDLFMMYCAGVFTSAGLFIAFLWGG
ncbi:MAG: hypothetical protein GY758_00960 [Fuerstiella sp.]|nr:hypothetical protein [Fuerstiella sp.]